MKKSVKMVVALVLALVMVVGTQESFFATTKYWTINKPIGSTQVSTEVEFPYYKGEITYQLTNWYNPSCSYFVVVCNYNPIYTAFYYIDGYHNGIRLTDADTVTFKMGFTNAGLQVQPNLSFVVRLEHNASNVSSVAMSATGAFRY